MEFSRVLFRSCAIANRYLQSSNPDYKPAIRRLVELAVDKMSTL